MTKTIEEIMANFTSDEQAEIQAEANKLIAEEIKRQEQSKGTVKTSHINYKIFVRENANKKQLSNIVFTRFLLNYCLLDKAKNNPQGLRFDEFETLLGLCDWIFDHQTGSHRIWYSTQKVRLSIQPTKNGKAKAYQVKQFLNLEFEEK